MSKEEPPSDDADRIIPDLAGVDERVEDLAPLLETTSSDGLFQVRLARDLIEELSASAKKTLEEVLLNFYTSIINRAREKLVLAKSNTLRRPLIEPAHIFEARADYERALQHRSNSHAGYHLLVQLFEAVLIGWLGGIIHASRGASSVPVETLYEVIVISGLLIITLFIHFWILRPRI